MTELQEQCVQAGRLAFRERGDAAKADCPHPIGAGDPRKWWFDGFYSERIRPLLERIHAARVAIRANRKQKPALAR